MPESRIWTEKEVRTTRWARLAASHVRSKFPQHPPPAIRVLKSLAEGFYGVNPERSPTAYITAIDQLMARIDEKEFIKGMHYGKIPDSLTVILQEKLSLQTDILTEALHGSRLPIWFSRFPSDIWFGGRAYPLEQSPEGLSLLFNPPAFLCTQGASTARRLIDNLCKVKASEKPTRAVLVLPELPLDGKDMNLADYARSKNFLEILRFPRGTFRFEIPTGFSQEEPDLMSPFQGEVTIFLFLNTKSLLFDPIDWGDLERALLEWNSVYCPQGAIPQSTRQKFPNPPREHGTEKKRVNVLSLMSSHGLKADTSLLRKQVHDGHLCVESF